MLYLPFYSTELFSKKSVQTLQVQLERLIHPPLGSVNVPSKKAAPKFIGHFQDRHFLLKEKVKTYRTIQVVVDGDLQATSDGSRLKMSFRPNTVNIIIMSLWFLVLIWACIQAGKAFSEGFRPELLSPFALLILSYLFLVVSTNMRIMQLKDFLYQKLDLLNDQPIRNVEVKPTADSQRP